VLEGGVGHIPGGSVGIVCNTVGGGIGGITGDSVGIVCNTVGCGVGGVAGANVVGRCVSPATVGCGVSTQIDTGAAVSGGVEWVEEELVHVLVVALCGAVWRCGGWWLGWCRCNR
jgi:hypothetical protein